MLPTITRKSYRPFYVPNLFDDDLFSVFQNRNNSMPAVNISEDDKNYNLDLAIPGVDKDVLKIDINEDVLTISAETKNETDENKNGYKRKEFSYSSFCRSFYIPDNVKRESIEAKYRDGILNVILPKQEEEKNKITRQIKIS